MTVKAFAIVVGLIELDVFGPRRRAEILDVNVAQASELGAKAAVEAVVGVTGVAGVVRRNAMVLKMGAGMERSMCVEAAMEPQSTGRIQKAKNTSIFPAVETVIEGRKTMIAIRIAVITSRAFNRASGDGKFNAMSPHSQHLDSVRRARRSSVWLLLLAKFPNITDKLFDLIVAQLALVWRHFLALSKL